VSVRNFKI